MENSLEVEMAICRKCLRPFDKHQDSDHDPARELAEIFWGSTNSTDEDDLCPDCRKELGISNLLGFGL